MNLRTEGGGKNKNFLRTSYVEVPEAFHVYIFKSPQVKDISLTLVGLREHDDRLHPMVANHHPKVVDGPREGALRSDELPTPITTLKVNDKITVGSIPTPVNRD